MHGKHLLVTATLWTLLVLTPSLAHAGPVTLAEFSLGQPTFSGNVASLSVALEFEADPGFSNYALSYVALDVSTSSPALIPGGSDYSAFTFELDTTSLPGWAILLDSNFGNVTNPSRVEFDDQFVNSVPSGTYNLGTIKVDLGILGLTPSAGLVVAITGPGTQVGAWDPNDPVTFDLYPGSFNPGTQALGTSGGGSGGGGGPGGGDPTGGGTVPEPASWVVFALCGGAALGVGRAAESGGAGRWSLSGRPYSAWGHSKHSIRILLSDSPGVSGAMRPDRFPTVLTTRDPTCRVDVS